MSYESDVEPIRLGILFDFMLPGGFPKDMWQDFCLPFEMIFEEGRERGLIDRPVELVFRHVEGMPKGTVKAVIDGYGELVDEGCLAVFGPNIGDNAVALREHIEDRFKVPSLSVTGSDAWLGEWTFAMPQGSHTDEPIFWAELAAKGGHTEVAALIEESLVGDAYIRNLRKACAALDIRIVAEEWIPQVARDVTPQVRRAYEAKATALMHCGFGFGLVFINPALEALGWDPPRYMGTAWQNGFLTDVMWKACLGWVGLDQFDEGNQVGQRFLDRYEQRTGRRPGYFLPLVNRDIATILLHAFADAHPLSPRGVKEALERVKMIPAASGSPGTRLSFGQWTRRGWMGAGYLVARAAEEEFGRSNRVARFGED
ncbi:MAG TPA: ABC transporter substrate-binding protein [Acidimicrobiales bacterium]|nr:ABC transporter substrate-binding protein [Acidimicrobiales bacterium]